MRHRQVLVCIALLLPPQSTTRPAERQQPPTVSVTLDPADPVWAPRRDATRNVWLVTSEPFLFALTGDYSRCNDCLMYVAACLVDQESPRLAIDDAAGRRLAASLAALRNALDGWTAILSGVGERPGGADASPPEETRKLLRQLSIHTTWTQTPFLAGPRDRAQTRALLDLPVAAAALLGRLRERGWLVRTAEDPNATGAAKLPEGLLPNVRDPLGFESELLPPAWSVAPAFGAGGALRSLETAQTHLRALMSWLDEPRGGPGGAPALWRTLAAYLDETAWLGGQAEAADKGVHDLLSSHPWLAYRLESQLALLAWTQRVTHRSLIGDREVGLRRGRRLAEVLLLMSPACAENLAAVLSEFRRFCVCLESCVDGILDARRAVCARQMVRNALREVERRQQDMTLVEQLRRRVGTCHVESLDDNAEDRSLAAKLLAFDSNHDGGWECTESIGPEGRPTRESWLAVRIRATGLARLRATWRGPEGTIEGTGAALRCLVEGPGEAWQRPFAR